MLCNAYVFAMYHFLDTCMLKINDLCLISVLSCFSMVLLLHNGIINAFMLSNYQIINILIAILTTIFVRFYIEFEIHCFTKN